VSNWALVIGVDDYGTPGLNLSGAVRDAERFRDWVLEQSAHPVAEENLRFLTARTDGGEPGDGIPTKDNVVAAINDVIARSNGAGDALFFFFSGHGLTAWVANREEGAILTPGFDAQHPEHSLAIRSVLEFFETLQYKDQFFFIDACRNAPQQDFEIGRWPIPRRRDPGLPPVQQFVLYATSPGLTAAEDAWEGLGEFTKVLVPALEGDAKAWSWERNCYEVRWEKLATHVKDAMEAAKIATRPGHHPPEGGWPIQVPQDTGSRGVEGRQRDALLASIPRTAVPPIELTIELSGDPRYDEAELSILDAVAAPVASALKVTDESYVFTLPPKTYAVVARTTDKRVGRVEAPIDLYDKPLTRVIPLGPEGPVAEPRLGEQPGKVVVEAVDPLTIVELRDEAGTVVEAQKVDGASGRATFEQPAGFYRVRLIGPGGPSDEQFVVLGSGEEARANELRPAEAAARTIALAKAAGGRYDGEGRALSFPQFDERLEWAAPSTIMAVALGIGLGGGRSSVLAAPAKALAGKSGVAFYGVDFGGLDGLRVRVWPAGEGIPKDPAALTVSKTRTVSLVHETEPGPHWLAIEHKDATTVVALPVLPGRLATVIAQFGAQRPRVYQFHPSTKADSSSTPERLRRVEHLQRTLLSGWIDGAHHLARELAGSAAEDPFAGLLAGYVLLRMGSYDELPAIADAVSAAAPRLSDSYILRGEYAAHGADPDLVARDQAFAQAINSGIPAFGEGLTRLIEGLRASGLMHPRAALVRHIFQQHARGLMWAAFEPLRPLEPGQLVIRGSDLGNEA
jgi:Caspase domain